MEGQKKANWADESEEEWSDQERPAPEQKSHVTAHSSRREALINQVKTHSLPFTLYLSNLSYRISDRELAKELQVSESAEIKLEFLEGKPTGQATIKVTSLEDALKVAEKNDTEVCGRSFIADINGFYSYSRGSGRGGGRGAGRRGNRRGGRNEGRRNFDDYKSYDKPYENRGQNKYQDRSERYDKGGERGYGRPYAGDEEKQPEKVYAKRFENKGKVENKGKITIAPSDDTPKTALAPQPVANKPKSNPFGQAKPVDTLNRDLEFEKKLETEKKVDDDQGQEKKYKIKETSGEVKETQHKADETVEKVENTEKVVDLGEKPQEYEEHDEGYTRQQGQRRARRGNYRKKADGRQEHERRREGEAEHYNEEPRTHENWGLENTENKQEDNRRNFDRNNYNKRAFDDRRQNDSRRGGQGGQYEKRTEKRGGNRNYEERKNEDRDPAYVKHYENKKKDGVKVNAWGNPDLSAEILKKPKTIQEEEKQTKKGTTYIKKSYRELGSQ